MISKEKLWEIRTSWILPSGEVIAVPSEAHDRHLPPGYKTVENAEKGCVRVSCCWGYTAPISKIFLPDKITVQQAQKLIDINESAKVAYDFIKDIEIYHSRFDWKEILELI